MKRLHRPPSPSETIQLIEQIAVFVNEGDSIILARKKVCGNQNSMKTRAVLKHPLYLQRILHYITQPNPTSYRDWETDRKSVV